MLHQKKQKANKDYEGDRRQCLEWVAGLYQPSRRGQESAQESQGYGHQRREGVHLDPIDRARPCLHEASGPLATLEAPPFRPFRDESA